MNLISSITRNLAFLKQCSYWYANVIFKTTSPLFTQVYTIHCTELNFIIRLISILMWDKDMNSYVHIF